MISGPTVFCYDGGLLDARQGPFMMYSVAVEDVPTRPLYRCRRSDGPSFTGHFFSADAKCEGQGLSQGLLGYMAVSRGGEMLRALYRCKDQFPGRRMHSLDLYCDTPDGNGKPLGFVR